MTETPAWWSRRQKTAATFGQSSLALPRHRELEIVEELAVQIEDSYESLIAGGLSDEEAWSELPREIPDWKTVRNERLEAEPLIVRAAHTEPAG